MINATGLTKYYGLNCAVDNLTFTAEKGEILGFLGPNGAGKTTTMRILTGYLPPTSGKVSIGGYDVIEDPIEVRKLVGYLPETVPLYTDMRVIDYLKFMGQLHQIKDINTRIEKVLEQVAMTERSRSFIGKLSKGMRQRIGLAQALIHEPEVLILDEPTIGLDPAQIIEIRNLIKELGKEKTILLSTHILSEAQQLCDQVMIINHGKLVAEDTPENLQQRLSGTRKTFIKVAENPEQALSVIKNLPGVPEAYLNEQNKIVFTNAKDQDLRPMVVRALVSADINLLELYPESVNLEDIFLQLIHEEKMTETKELTSIYETLEQTEETELEEEV